MRDEWLFHCMEILDSCSGQLFSLCPDRRCFCRTGRLSARCNVYSFGVVLLELLSGRRAVDKSKVEVEQNLVDWAKPYLCDKRKLHRIMDVKLEGQYPWKGAFMAAFLAFECIGDAKRRPSMTEVLTRLEKIPVPKESTATAGQVQRFGSSPQD